MTIMNNLRSEKTLQQLNDEDSECDSVDSLIENEAMVANFTELEAGLKKCFDKIKNAGGRQNQQTVDELVDYYERREQMHRMDKETIKCDLSKAKEVIGDIPDYAKAATTDTAIVWADKKYPETGLLQVIEQKDNRILNIRDKAFKYKWKAQFAYIILILTHVCRTFPRQTLFIFEEILIPLFKEFVHGSSKWSIFGRYILVGHFSGYYALKAGLPSVMKKIKDLSPF